MRTIRFISIHNAYVYHEVKHVPKRKSKAESGIITAVPKPAYKRITFTIEEELYKKLWQIVSKRYLSPTRKFYLIANEALREYVEKHKQELEG
jgi:hypothetical protein